MCSGFAADATGNRAVAAPVKVFASRLKIDVIPVDSTICTCIVWTGFLLWCCRISAVQGNGR